MSNTKDVKENIGYLGATFQFKTFWQLLTNVKFAEEALPYLASNYYDDSYHRRLITLMRDYQEKNAGRVPSIKNGSIYETINELKVGEDERDTLTAIIHRVEQWETNIAKGEIPFDGDVIQSKLYKFIKQQEYKNLGQYIETGVKQGRGDDEFIADIEEKIKRISLIGQSSDEGVDLFYNIDDVLREDYRDTIPTGIGKIDQLMNGGLGRGEMGMILAGPGTGKSTILTKIANTALNHGKNVLQIIFEDTYKDIIRKHFCIWSGVPLPDFSEKRDFVKEKVLEKHGQLKGRHVLIKFPEDGITIPFIERWIMDYQKRTGVVFDLIVLDYIDCVESHKKYKDKLEEELKVIKSFIGLLDKLNIPGWSAVQGNRDSVSSAFIQSNQISGSFKKTHKVHFMMSIAKSPLQKTYGRANVQILKSRIGDDGLAFEDVIFDNKRMFIDITDKPNKITKDQMHQHEEETAMENEDIMDIVRSAFGEFQPDIEPPLIKEPVIEVVENMGNPVEKKVISQPAPVESLTTSNNVNIGGALDENTIIEINPEVVVTTSNSDQIDNQSLDLLRELGIF